MKTKRFFIYLVKKDGIHPLSEFRLYKRYFISCDGLARDACELMSASFYTEREYGGFFHRLWIRPKDLPIPQEDYEMSKAMSETIRGDVGWVKI